MSMDYPDYLRIRQKSKFLGFLWVIGDIGYYLGLIGAWVGPIIVYNLRSGGLGPAFKIFLLFAGLFLISVVLKQLAHGVSGIHKEDAQK